MTPRANLSQATWTFVNHQRLPDIMRGFGITFNSALLSALKARGVVDSSGIPIFQKRTTGTDLETIYDRFEWDDSNRLHSMYVQAVDNLIEVANPIELGAIWNKREIRSLVKPGSICFCMRGFRFKSGVFGNRAEDRKAYARSKGIEVRFLANTRHMYGSSALYDSFMGHRFAATLLFVKDVGTEGDLLVVRATPLAMGAGFVPFAYRTPQPLRYGWVKHNGQAAEDAEIPDF